MKNPISKRHHYLPQYFIKGFTNNSGRVFVYDKVKDSIWDKDVSSNGIFFEFDRNSLVINGGKNSFIEDVLFNKIDNDDSKLILFFRNLIKTGDDYTFEDVVKLQSFLIKLLWRLPKYDTIFQSIFERAIKTNPGGTLYTFKNIEHQQALNKIERVLIPFRIIRERIAQKVVDKFFTNIFRDNSYHFLLGDYPIVYRHEPTGLNDLLYKEMFFPISTNQIFSLFYKREMVFDLDKMIAFNTRILHQSIRYVCCSNKMFLKKSVAYYKSILSLGTIDDCIKELFDYQDNRALNAREIKSAP